MADEKVLVITQKSAAGLRSVILASVDADRTAKPDDSFTVRLIVYLGNPAAIAGGHGSIEDVSC